MCYRRVSHMHTLVLTIHNGVGVGVRWVGVTQRMEGSRQVSGNLLFQYFCKQIQKNEISSYLKLIRSRNSIKIDAYRQITSSTCARLGMQWCSSSAGEGLIDCEACCPPLPPFRGTKSIVYGLQLLSSEGDLSGFDPNCA